MAVKRPGNDDGNFITWLQANLASLNKIAGAHEERMQEMKRSQEEMKRSQEETKKAHEAGMKEIRQIQKILANGLVGVREEVQEVRRQTREIILELSRLDTERKRDRKVFEAALKKLVGGVSKLDGRVRRLEPKPKKKSTKKKRK